MATTAHPALSDPDAALALLRQLADEVPPDQQIGIVYTRPNGKPGCIAGHFMERTGQPRPAHGSNANLSQFRWVATGMDPAVVRLVDDVQETTDDMVREAAQAPGSIDVSRAEHVHVDWHEALERMPEVDHLL